MSTLTNRAKAYIKEVDSLMLQQQALIQTRETIEKNVEELRKKNELTSKDLNIVTNALAILNSVSDESVNQSYEFITESINTALERIFSNSKRQIKLREYLRSNMYPQLEIELITDGGIVRSLKEDSGHGISQIVSLLCILSLIVITGGRRLLVLDEMLSGLSANAMRIISEILWTFTKVGFQFVVSEHGLAIQGSHVYHLEMQGGVSKVKRDYIEKHGIFLDGDLDKRGVTPSEATEPQAPIGEIAGEIKSGNIIQI